MKSLCLNMIVKNEMANLERCLEAVAPYVSCWVIGDTGSSDGTQEFINGFFGKRGIPGELHEFPFKNFEQARNEALKRAYESSLEFDYLLFDDADMELVVEDGHFRDGLEAPGYQLMQLSAGGLRYWNTRLVRRDAGAWYHGVTHEYLDVPGGTQQLGSVWYRDHASGSNRVDKFERDIRLLKSALKRDPDNVRYWFYLAQSYQDAGRPKEAAEAYRKRAGMGGWVEEVWTSKLRLARNLLKSGDDAGFVSTALAAFQERSSRAEPLYDLARHYRIKGEYELAAMFAERGLEVPPPTDDILFVEDWVYRYGLREEFSIAANYARDPGRKARGFAACDSLALDPDIPAATRDLARSNLQFYVRPASELLPSFSLGDAEGGAAVGSLFVESWNPIRVLDDQRRTVGEPESPIATSDFCSASPLVPFAGGWLGIARQIVMLKDKKEHWHRFVAFDSEFGLKRVSRPFYFADRGTEVATGLVWSADGRSLTISLGDEGNASATVSPDNVADALDDVENLADWWRGRKGGPPAVTPERSLASGSTKPRRAPSAGASTPDFFIELAPFLRDPDSPVERRRASREFDVPIEQWLDRSADSLPQVHTYYEVLSDHGRHDALRAAVASMRSNGHPVCVWSYAPERLSFLEQFGVELTDAAEVVPKALFEEVLAGTEIRYFSDIFRYAVLYEHGGLWMDGDVVLLRPFPYKGDHFFNLQWRPGARNEHFICGNVIYARRNSEHLKNLYDRALELFFTGEGRAFGDVGPKLLSDYIASPRGAELVARVFSPMFFNSIDWTESELFDRPLAALRDYINDDRIFGFHMWTARHDPQSAEGASLLSLLSQPLKHFPRLADLAERFDTDRNRHTGNHHAYSRIYEKLIGDRRLALRTLLEITRIDARAQAESAKLWAEYFPFAEILSAGTSDPGQEVHERVTSIRCDQADREAIRSLASEIASKDVEVIIDDGSHASADQQATLKLLFPALSPGGWYFIEDLDWQPEDEDRSTIMRTKDLLAAIKGGAAADLDPYGINELEPQFEEILFFDSHYELDRAHELGGLVAIRKRGGSKLV